MKVKLCPTKDSSNKPADTPIYHYKFTCEAAKVKADIKKVEATQEPKQENHSGTFRDISEGPVVSSFLEHLFVDTQLFITNNLTEDMICVKTY